MEPELTRNRVAELPAMVAFEHSAYCDTLSGDCLGKLWGRPGEGPVHGLPADAFTGAVAVEPDPGIELAPVQVFDRVVQPLLGVLVGPLRQRIIEVYRPGLFLEGIQDALLVGRPLD